MLKKPKKPSKSRLKGKAWDAFSKYIRLRDWHNQGQQYIENSRVATCFTCPRMYPIEGKGCLQAGHFIPGRGGKVLFDEEQVHVQCYHCNHHLKGAWTRYYQRMVSIHGQEKVNQMIADSHETKQYKTEDLEELLVEFNSRVKELS